MMILLFAYLNILTQALGHLSMEKPDKYWRPGIGIDSSGVDLDMVWTSSLTTTSSE